MFSERCTSSTHIKAFWSWFRSVERQLHDRPESAPLLATLEQRLAAIHPDLAWELGPMAKSPRMSFAVSPDLQHELLAVAQAVCAGAYESKLWRFMACKPAKPWNKALEIDFGQGTSRDACLHPLHA